MRGSRGIPARIDEISVSETIVKKSFGSPPISGDALASIARSRARNCGSSGRIGALPVVRAICRCRSSENCACQDSSVQILYASSTIRSGSSNPIRRRLIRWATGLTAVCSSSAVKSR
jgi:hypothetical protein